MPPNPKLAFANAVTRLNGKNQFDLWSISCILSCIDYFDGLEDRYNFLFPTLHSEKIALLHRAILESKCTDYKESIFETKDVAYVLNALNDTTYQRAGLLKGDEDPSVRLRRMFSSMAHQQIRPQENLLRNRIGRTYAMFHDIPLRFKDELAKKQGDKFVDLTKVVNAIGLSSVDFLAVGFGIISLIQQRFDSNNIITEDARKYAAKGSTQAVERHAQILCSIVEISRSVRASFTFSVHDLVMKDSLILTEDNVKNYLHLLSRTTKQLRDLMRSEKVYKEGLIPDRLNPLERYPIVELSNGRYIVPNLRYFDAAATDVIHFILQEAYPDNSYNQLRGYIQEIYLKLLLQDRLPELDLVPETSYRKAKNRIEGPDLTIIDTTHKNLLALESKAKRIRVISRVNPGASYLLDDLSSSLDAVKKLPAKIDDLFDALPEYATYQEKINQAKEKKPIAVVVMGEGVYFMNGLLNDFLSTSPNHWLHKYSFPYCLMSIETFEKAVEVASANKIALYEIMYQYWIDSKSTNINQPAAESFSNRPVVYPTFNEAYAKLFFQDFVHAHGRSRID